MNWKRFLKPDWRKIKFFIILLVIIFLVDLIKSYYTYDYWTWGIPFVFSRVWGPCPEGMKCGGSDFRFLILDIVILYIASLLIVWIYDKLKKR